MSPGRLLSLTTLLALALACGGAGEPLAPGPPVSIASDVPAPPDHVSLDLGPVRVTELGPDLDVGDLLSVGTVGDPGTILVRRAEIVDLNGTPEAVVVTIYATETQAEALLAHRGPVVFHVEIPWGIEAE